MGRRLIIDSHLDLAWNALSWKRDLLLPLSEMNRLDAKHDDRPGRGRATVCWPELRKAAVATSLATLMGRVPYGEEQIFGSDLDFPTHEGVYGFASGQLAYYEILETMGVIKILRDRDAFTKHIECWETEDDTDRLPLGIIIAMEGSDAIVHPDQAAHWYGRGLRCASLVHYGRSKYAVGTGEEGPLTVAGRELLAQFEKIGMILDVTHLSDTSFFEAMDRYGGPVLASHQNCRKLVPGCRQFSDEQLSLVIERSGVIGVAMDAWMLYPHWERGKTDRRVVGLTAVVDQVEHICNLAGNSQHVAIGSDLDGGFGTEQTPTGLDSISDLHRIADLLSQRQFGDDDIDAFFYKNWHRFFTQHLPPEQ